MSKGVLVVVGTGIQVTTHITAQAESLIRQADKVFYTIPDQLGDAWMQALNATAESLSPLYKGHKRRLDTYQFMVERMITAVRAGLNVCAVFYGHPGVFVLPAHEAIKQARAEGFRAWMCPGISAEDCLFADLNIDPATYGCQTYEATDFLINHPQIDTSSHLILWQIGAIGNMQEPHKRKAQGIKILTEVLQHHYLATHLVTVYEAAPHPNYSPRIQATPLHQLPQATLSSLSTLYVPPCHKKSPDYAMMARLGISPQDVTKEW